MKFLFSIALEAFLFLMMTALGSCSKDKSVEIDPDPDAVVYIANERGVIYAIEANTGKKIWTYWSYSRFFSSPMVVDGILYIGADSGYFFAIDANTGQEKWVIQLERGLSSTPSIVNNTAYVGSKSGYLYAIDIIDGHVIWELESYGYISSLVVADGVIYCGSDDQIFAVDPRTRMIKWRFHLQNALNKPVVENGIVYFSDWTETFYALDAQTGQVKWTFGEDDLDSGALPFSTNTVFFILREELTSVDVNAGRKKWSYAIENSSSVNPTPAVRDGFVYVQSRVLIESTGNSGGDKVCSIRLHAINAETGSLKWVYNSSDRFLNKSSIISSVPTASNSSIYLVSEDGYLRCISSTSGILRWRVEADGDVWGSPCVVTSRGRVRRGLGNIDL